jgi:hypothetical protein
LQNSDFESIEKNARKSHKKFIGPKFPHNNKVKGFTYHQSLLITFFALIVLQLFQRLPNQHQIQRFDTHIEKKIVCPHILALIAHFEANAKLTNWLKI